MLVSHKVLNGQHLTTDFFQQRAERKRRLLVEKESRAGTEAGITAYGIPLAPVTSFKYLGIILLDADDNWPEMVSNLQRACRKWVRLTRVLSREGVDAWTSGQIYLAVVQSVMLYRSET